MRTLEDIKFRFYNNKLKEFVSECNLEGILREKGPWENLKDVIPNQYTGLKDKNGKEIYESDIIKFFEETVEEGIYFSIKVIEYLLEEVGSNMIFTGFCLDAYSHECEIIGNIYENPELIPKGSEHER